MQSLNPASQGGVDEETPPTDRNISIDSDVDEENHLEHGNIETQFEDDRDAEESSEDVRERRATRIVSRAKVKAIRNRQRR